MYLFHLFPTLFIFFHLSNVISSSNSNCFRVAVYEHIPINEPTNLPLNRMMMNFAILEKAVKKASYENVKLIVLPECAMQGPFSKELMLKEGLSPIVPSLNTNLCDIYKKKLKYLKSKSKIEELEKLKNLETETIDGKFLKNIAILRKFSCLAANHEISIAVNLYTMEINSNYTYKQNDNVSEEKVNNTMDMYDFFNTDLVFDSKGKLIAKYRKFHLFGESQVTSLPEAEEITFENEYGKFGLAICADILFEQPIKNLVEKRHIDHLIFSTAWFDPELPVLSAVNFHSATATRYNINIISANRRNLSAGSFGSGIYDAKTGVRIQSKFNNHNLLLISELPVKKNLEDNECNYAKRELVGSKIYKNYDHLIEENIYQNTYKRLKVPFEQFKSARLENTEDILNICYNKTCCHLNYKMNENFDFDGNDYYNYYLISFDGIKDSQDPHVFWYEQICALILYDETNKSYLLNSSIHFDKFELKAEFNTTNIYSNILTSDLQIIPKNKWSFYQQGNLSEISFEKLEIPITSATLYARNFELDPF